MSNSGTDDAAEQADVVVVGGGLAGLNAARKLQQANRTVVLLEARDEVGGRTRSRTLDGRVADFGGEWIGRAHVHTRTLARDLGLTLEPARNIGHPIRWRLPSGDSVGRLPPRPVRRDLARVIIDAARLARQINARTPWKAPRAAELDSRSTADWFSELGLGTDTRYLLERLIGSLCSQSLDQLSLLHFLWWLRLAGGPLRTMHTTFQWRVTSGAQELSRGIARELGDSIRLSSPVRRLHQQGDRIVVTTEHGAVFKASRAILAVPVPHVGRIELQPPLPTAQQDLELLQIGAGTKVIAVLPPHHDVRHNTVIGGDRLWAGWKNHDRVTGFAPLMESELPEPELLGDLADAFGVRPDDLTHVTVFRWGDEQYISGCDAAFRPGQVQQFGPWLTQPHGRIHFAGAERSSWPNNMEGALESGDRAAAEAMNESGVTAL